MELGLVLLGRRLLAARRPWGQPRRDVNLFRHTYNTLRPHQALDERTPRAAYLAVEHCDWRVAFGGPAA
jgi:hypothetical protein